MTEYALAPHRTWTYAADRNTPSTMLEQGLLRAYRVRSNGTMRHLDLYPLGSTLREAAEWVSDRIDMDGASVQAVARQLNVSTPTIRRYLESLELTEDIEAGDWDGLYFDSAGNPVFDTASTDEEEPACTCAAAVLDQAVHEPSCALYVPATPAPAQRPARTGRTCTVCGKGVTARNSAAKRYAALGYEDMCVACYDQAGLENEHSDGHHADAPNADCPQCKEAALLARNRARFTSTAQPTDAERDAALANVPGAECEPVGTPAEDVADALKASVAQARGAALPMCFCGDQGVHTPGATGCKHQAAPARRTRSHG